MGRYITKKEEELLEKYEKLSEVVLGGERFEDWGVEVYNIALEIEEIKYKYFILNMFEYRMHNENYFSDKIKFIAECSFYDDVKEYLIDRLDEVDKIMEILKERNRKEEENK